MLQATAPEVLHVVMQPICWDDSNFQEMTMCDVEANNTSVNGMLLDVENTGYIFASVFESAVSKMVTVDLNSEASKSDCPISPSCQPVESVAAGIKKSKREPRQTPVVEPMLPPCRICSEKASGFHYGANTCEACKAFFRRSLRNMVEYKCSADGNCPILPGKRNSCPACRLQKCIDVGMSKTAIKTGRYTHAKKAKDITEVKLLRAQKLQEQQQQQQQQQQSQQQQQQQQQSQQEHEVAEQRMDEEEYLQPLTVLSVSEDTMESFASTDVSPTTTAQPSPTPVTSSSRAEELEKIIQHITNVQRRLTPLTPEFMASLPEKQKLYLEQRALQQQIFGPMSPIGREEYMNLYRTTGIDIDGRRDLLQNHLLPQIEVSVKRFVTFVKAIPGFSQLPMEDQITLVKASRADVWMLLNQGTFNPTHRLLFTWTGQVLSSEDLVHYNGDNEFLDQLFDIQGRLQKLQLSDEECCILAAFCVLFTDRCTLIEPKTVERCQLLMLDCILHLMDKCRGGDSMFIAQIFNILVTMRNLQEMQFRVEEHLVMQWCDMVDFPPLFFEMSSHNGS